MPEAIIKLDTNAILSGVNKVLDHKQKYIKNDSMLYHNLLNAWKGIIEYRVPMEKGTLRKSATVTNVSGRWALVYDPENKYGRHYGAYQYYSPKVGNHIWNRHTPGTGGYWNRNVPKSDRQKLINAAKREIIRSWKNEG